MATKTVTALGSLSHFNLQLRPCIIEGKVNKNGVTLKTYKGESGLASLKAFVSQFKLEAKIVNGSRYLMAIVQIDAFNSATAEIEDKPAPAPVDLSEFENPEDEDEENEEEETEEDEDAE